MESNFKTVLLEINVPKGDYCWDGITPCWFFNNELGYTKCDMDLGKPEKTEDLLYMKPSVCRNLKDKT